MVLIESFMQLYVYLSPVVLALFFFSFLGTVDILSRIQSKSRKHSQFTGPPGWPIIGNLLAIHANAPEQCRQWARKYGHVFKMNVGRMPVLVVNNAAAAKQIFQHQSQNLGSRPSFFTHHQLIAKTSGVVMGTAPYSSSLNKSRKHVASLLSKPAVGNYVEQLDVETKSFMDQCLQLGRDGTVAVDPLRLLRRMIMSLNLMLCYGRRVSLEDPLLDEIVLVEHEMVNQRNFIHNLEDCIPILRLNPFSTQFRKARQLRKRRDRYFNSLNAGLDHRRANGTDVPCIRSALLDRPDIDEEQIQLTSLTFISAGMAPTSATLQWSIAMLAQRPDIQQAAYEALRQRYAEDENLRDVGPVYDDHSCAYIVALTRECLRSFSVAPFSLPRSATKDFFYDGKRIEAGTTVLLNVWACNFDPEIWPSDAETFDPTRWLENPTAPLFTYGLGYRACAGVPLTSRLLYLFFVRLISRFEIVKVKELDVNPLTGRADVKNLVTYHRPFEVLFKPRKEICVRDDIGAD